LVRLSQAKALKTLESLGFTQLDARVYVFLAKKVPQKAGDVARCLKIPKQTVYFIINNLQRKGIVTSTVERPARFSAVPFERVLDLFVNAKVEEAKQIQRNRDEILLDWQSVAVTENDDVFPKFAVLEGRNTIFSKIQQMVKQTKKHLLTMMAVPNLVRAEQFGLFDAVFAHPMRSSIQFRLLTELPEQDLDAVRNLLKRTPKLGLGLEIRSLDLGLKLNSRMIIRDYEEAIFFINRGADLQASEKDDVCLWTNCKSLVDSFTAVFEDLWRNSTDIEKKITEIETGKQTQKATVIGDAETAHSKYHEAMRSAKEEIVMITSSRGLIACLKGSSLVRDCTQRGVSVKIMAPITSENLDASQQLLQCCEVRHVPTGYLGTTIIDGQHLFQFKNPPPDEEALRSIVYFENTFYTNDSEYVTKTKNMLNDIWKNAQVPSAITLDFVNKPPEPTADSLSTRTIPRTVKKINGPILIEDEKSLVELTEKDVLNKIINDQKHSTPTCSKHLVRLYGSIGQAIIRPPEYFNLPDTLIHILHFEKHSTYGAEDAIIVMLRLKTPKGYAFVPTAFVGDNPIAIDFWKKIFAGIPFEQNIQLVRKDELQIRIHGNTLFAGWTVQIPLLHPPYNLPPSALLLEGYGNVKTSTYSISHPSGYKVIHEYNGFEAFVTFLHPLSRYTGPGTDGFFGRDCVSTVYPP
jgi:sugar-specific transcriptional regulator TrmB